MSIQFLLQGGGANSDAVLAMLSESSTLFMVGDIVHIKNKNYIVCGREWCVQQAGHDVVPEECSLIIWVKP